MDPSIPDAGAPGVRPEYGPKGVGASSEPLAELLPAPIFRHSTRPTPENANLSIANATLPLLERQHSLESEDLPDTRKRRKLSEYAHLEALHTERARQEFSELQRESARDFDAMHGSNEGMRDSGELHSSMDDTHHDEVDITGSGDDLEDGHFVLQAQWQAQRDSVRKKKKRKSITFGERREPNDDRASFSPTKRTENRTMNALAPSSGRAKLDMTLGTLRSRVHSKRRNNAEDEALDSDEEGIGMIVDEAGEEVTTLEFYKASNVAVSKMDEDEDADILEDSHHPFKTPTMAETTTSISAATNSAMSPPRIKLTLRKGSGAAIPTAPPVARRSSRLHKIDIVEYEYDVNDPTNEEDASQAQFKSPTRPIEHSRRKAPNTAPSKKSAKALTPSSKASATPKPVKKKLDHGITSETDLEQFYLSLQRTDYQKKVVQPKGMVPVLFSYQLRAVSWMAERESKLFFRDGVRGGILADEMGLGKTIEMMALIISNPRSKFFRPPSAPVSQTSSQNSRSTEDSPAPPQTQKPLESTTMDLENQENESDIDLTRIEAVEDAPPSWKPFLVCDPWIDPPVNCHDSSCTLIVCPDILLSQWKEELARHAPSLVVSTYRGVPALTPLEIAFDQNGDSIFATYDVVLCSYETMAREFPYATKPNVKTRMQTEQNSTPLTKLRWWRIVMDEAQMFSQGASNAGKLLRDLLSVNRWAVSGTPVRKDFSDLRGLLLFLDAEYCYFKPTDEALSFIRTISWRHQMEQVSDEIIIPPSENHLLPVTFTRLESFGHAKLAKKLKHSEEQQEVQEAQPNPTEDETLPSTSDAPALKSDAPLASWITGDLLSLGQGKYASCPYHVMHEKYLETKAVLASSDRSLLCRSLSSAISNEFYSSQLAVCHAYNDLGDANLAQAQHFQALLSVCENDSSKSSLQAAIGELAQKAIDCYQFAVDLVTYRTNTPIHDKLVHLLTPLFALSPPSAPFSTVWYHTLKGMSTSLAILGRYEEVGMLENRAETVRGRALQSQLNSVASARFKFSGIKQETSRLVRNRLNFTRGEWWFHALKWIGVHVPEFCARIRHGVAQNLDTKFSGLRTHTLQLNVTTVEDVIDKLDLDFGRMQAQRSDAIGLAKTPVPTSGSQLDAFYQTLDATDEALYQYQHLLMPEKTLHNNVTGQGFSAPILNLAERLLLHIEYVIVDRYNITMQEYRYHPDRVSAEDEATLFKLGRWSLMAEASFRELELMKLEVEQGQAYNKVKRGFAVSLGELEDSALPKSLQVDRSPIKPDSDEKEFGTMDIEEPSPEKPSELQAVGENENLIPSASSTISLDLESDMAPFNLHLAKLREKLHKALGKCLSCKHQLEFVLDTGREKAPRSEAFGSKIGVVVNKLVEVLQDSEEQVANPSLLRNKALVFSKWSEPLIQVAALLKEHGIQFHFGKDAGFSDNKNAKALAQRLAAFRDDPELRVLFLNSRSQSTGLTLTQANHVFILEDLESAHELQAVGRAHRIGQTRATHIWKFTTQPGQTPDFSGDIEDLMC